MRDIAFTPSKARQINGRITFRDTHLRFRKFPMNGQPTATFHDIDLYGDGFVRVAVVPVVSAWRLAYQYVSTPNTFTNPLSDNWPLWTVTDIEVEPRSGVALHGSRAFFQARTGEVCYVDLSGGLVVQVLFATANKPYAFAPVSENEVYLQWRIAADAPFSKIGLYILSTGMTEWSGRIYGASDYLSGFDAVRLNNRDRIYFADEGGNRTLYLTKKASVWSDVRQLVPLDVVDDTSAFILGGASIINNQIWLSGVLKRDKNFPMHVHMREITEDHYSLDREMFIRSGQTREKIVDFGAEVSFVMPPGKLILVNDILWYIAPESAYYAYATSLVGVDREEFKLTTSAFDKMTINTASNQGNTFQVSLGSALQSSMVRSGNEAVIELGYDGQYAQVGRFDISAGTNGFGEKGRARAIMGGSYASKRMAQWEPDANFDYWSQTKTSANPTELSKLIRVSGKWEGSTQLTLKKLNVAGFMYAVDRPSRNQLVRARFKYTSGVGELAYQTANNYTPAFGVALQFYSDTDIGKNGILAYYCAGKIHLDLLRGQTQTELASANFSMTQSDSQNEHWYWIMADFHDGLIHVSVGAVDNSTKAIAWSEVISHTFEGTDAPWVRDDFVGRGGLYMKNVTPCSMSYPFSSNDMIVPLESITDFPNADWVIADDEIIEYNGKSYPVRQTNLYPANGDTVVGNVHEENLTDWVTFAYEPEAQISAAIQTFQLPANFYVNGVKAYIRKEPGMTQDLQVAIYQGPRDEKKPVGVKIASGRVSNEDITEEGSWVIGNFGTPMFLNKANAYWVVWSQAEDPGNPHEAGFSIAYSWTPGEDAVPGALYTFQEDADEWLNEPGDALFALLGSTSVNAWTIILQNLEPPNNVAQYNDMALIIVGGAGKDELFKVIGYGGVTEAGNHIVFVDRNPAGVAGEDSVYDLAPTLKVKTRGALDTTATYHGRTLVSLYRVLSPYSDKFEYFSSEIDMRIEDVIQEIAAKAGVVAYSDKECPASSDVGTSAGPSILGKNTIIKFQMPTVATRYVIRHSAGEIASGYADRVYVEIDGDVLRLVCGGALDQRTVAGDKTGVWVTLSVFENFISVWYDQRYIYTFSLDMFAIANNMPGESNTLVAASPSTLNVDFSQCQNLRDNYILDMGTNGLSLLGELLKERRIFFQDDAFGRLRLGRNKTAVDNPDGEPYRLTANADTASADSEFASRIRLVGAEIAEGIDRSALADYGNVFRLKYSQVLDYESEIVEETRRTLVDVASSLDQYSLTGAFDLRLEPNDVINALIDGATAVKLAIQGLSIVYIVAEDNATLDMQLTGQRHVPYDGASDIVVSSLATPLDWTGGGEDPVQGARSILIHRANGTVSAFTSDAAGFIEAMNAITYNESMFIPPVEITIPSWQIFMVPGGTSIIGSGKDATKISGPMMWTLGQGATLKDLHICSDVGTNFTTGVKQLIASVYSSSIRSCKVELTAADHVLAILHKNGTMTLYDTDVYAKATGEGKEAACLACFTDEFPASWINVYGGELVSSTVALAAPNHPPLLPSTAVVSPEHISYSGTIVMENVA